MTVCGGKQEALFVFYGGNKVLLICNEIRL